MAADVQKLSGARRPERVSARRRLREVVGLGRWLGSWLWPLVFLALPVSIRLLVPLFPWLLRALNTDAEGWAFQSGRVAGYLAAGCMIVPYLYVVRRSLLHHRLGSLRGWVRWHIAFAFLALGATLVHTDFRSFKPWLALTNWVMIFFGLVMLSGILGLLGHKVVFGLLPQVVDRELGLAGLEEQRPRLLEQARRLLANYSQLTPGDVLDWRTFGTLIAGPTEALAGPLGKAVSQLQTLVQKKMSERGRSAAELVRDNKAGPGHRDDLVEAVNVLFSLPELSQNLAELLPAIKERANDPTRSEEERKRWQLWLTEAGTVLGRKVTAEQAERRSRLYLEALAGNALRESCPPSGSVRHFFDEAVEPELSPEYSFWSWFLGRGRRWPLATNYYLRVKTMAGPAHQGMVDQLWQWLKRRRQMDREYRLHRLARLWVVAHSATAWALFGLVVVHIWGSLRYGGY